MRRQNIKLAVCVAAVLVLACLLPVLAFSVQDGQAQGRSVYTQEQKLNLSLSSGGGLAWWQRLETVAGDYGCVSLIEGQMIHTQSEAVDLATEWLSGVLGDEDGNLWIYSGMKEPEDRDALWREAEEQGRERYTYMTDGGTCYYLWNRETNEGFRTWWLFFYQLYGGNYISISLDDETGRPLSVYYDAGEEIWEQENRWPEEVDVDSIRQMKLDKTQELIDLFLADWEEEGISDVYLDTYSDKGDTVEYDTVSADAFRAVYGLEHPADSGHGDTAVTYVAVAVSSQHWFINAAS